MRLIGWVFLKRIRSSSETILARTIGMNFLGNMLAGETLLPGELPLGLCALDGADRCFFSVIPKGTDRIDKRGKGREFGNRRR